MNITQDLIPKGYRNRPGFANSMTYVTIHETGNSSKGANAKAHAKYLKDAGVNVPTSWHYTADDTNIYQHLPDNETGYHTGDGAKGTGTKTNIKGGGALNSIGIEICVNSDGNFSKAVENAAQLTAKLCKDHNIPIGRVVQHNFWKSSLHPNGKNCPQNLRAGKNGGWDGFIARVKELMGDSTAPAAVSVARSTLRRGDKGDEVQTLQTLLTAAGHTLSVDGSFGPATETAVKAFQKANGLSVDGVCGPKTWGKLDELTKAALPLTPADLRVVNEGTMLRVKISKVPNASGYQVQISENMNFTSGSGGSKAYEGYPKIYIKTCAGKPLMPGKTYYVRARSYVLDGEKKVWGEYCQAVSVKYEGVK